MRLGRLGWPHLIFLLALCAAPTASHAQLGVGAVPALEGGAPGKTVGAYRFQLDVLLAAEREPIEDLNNGYRRALEKLESRLQASGRLQELLAVREELRKFDADPDAYLPSETAEKGAGLPGLEQLRSTYRQERLTRNTEVARRCQPHLETTRRELEVLQVEFTKADRIEDALLAGRTIEEIDKRLAGIENGVVPAFLGKPLPSSDDDLRVFLRETIWEFDDAKTITFQRNGTVKKSWGVSEPKWRVKDMKVRFEDKVIVLDETFTAMELTTRVRDLRGVGKLVDDVTEQRKAALISGLAGRWKLTTSGWQFRILEDGRVTSEDESGKIEVIDLEQRLVKMSGFHETAIWRVADDLDSMSGKGVKGGSGHPAERE